MSSPAEEIDQIIASKVSWHGQMLAELRKVILSASSEITEDVKWKMPSKPLGSPTWELEGIICVADYLKNAVRLTFPKGAQVQDPQGLFNSRLDSKVARAINFEEQDQIPAEGLRQLVLEAAAVNQNLKPKK
ncbi:DUF1801 domain-containing protein [Aquiluna borgnonia]|nr:DUF1801 domain-containing protein [Aquiluna borgnonia]